MSTDIKKLKLVEDEENYTGGLLLKGEKINGYVITQKFDTDSGEAELYFCEKAGKKYILKYYYKKTIFSDLAEKLTSINHPNVIKILDVGEHKKHSYEIDEYYEGGSLSDQELPISEKEAFKVFEQINNGLNAIHQLGIIHRDIKAENIYYKDSSKKEIVIGDFGIATIYDQRDDVNEHLTKIDSGTDGYKAPESYNGVISPAIDYYAFGITVWNILTGKTPFVEESGEPYSSGRIRYETIEDKVKNYLLSETNNLSEKAKKLISGLLVYRHDQRWRYSEVNDFLSGKEVTVFEERRELPAFVFGDKELFTLKSIAEELLNNQELGIEIIKGTQLTRYLDRNDLSDITAKIEEIQDKYLSDPVNNNSFEDILGGFETDKEREEYALVKAAFAICNNITFPLTYFGKKYPINTISDFIDLLQYHPMAIRPYLFKESYGLYEKLSAIESKFNDESLAEWVKRYSDTFDKLKKNERTLPISLYLELTENKIYPFNDKYNANIVLSSKEDFEELDNYLKERLMYRIDAKDKLLIAWFENVYDINMDDWYSELEGGSYNDESIAQIRRNKLLAFDEWYYFELFLHGKDVIYRNYFVNNGKIGLLNLDGSVLLPAQFDDIHCEFIRDNFITKIGNEWFVYSKDDSEEGKYKSILSAKGELSVLNENSNEYKAEEEVDALYTFDKEKNEYYRYGIKNIQIGKIKAYSEISNHNVVFSNSVDGHFDILDSVYNKIDTFDKLQVITAEGEVPKKIKFWATKGNKVIIIDKDCNVLQELKYTSFEYVGNNYFIVTDFDGNRKVVDFEANVIQENVYDYRSSGIIATIKRNYKSKWELLNLADKTWKANGKKFKYVGYLGPSIFVLNSEKNYNFFVESKNQITSIILKTSGKGGIISNSNGLKKSFNAINTKTIKKAYIPSEEKKSYYNILGFDGKTFYKYDFGSNEFSSIESKKYVYSDEFTDLMDNVESKDIINLVKRYLHIKDFDQANIIINMTWEYYYQKEDYETVRFLLSEIRMDQMNNLDMHYLFYKNKLGYTYMKENEKLQDFYSSKDMVQKNQNYIHALHYLLSAAGKEIDEQGAIITAPYFAKLNFPPDLLLECELDCAEVCISISNVEQYLYLGYGWTKEYIRSVASDIMQSLINKLTDENTVNSETYLNTNKLGSLFESMNDYENALTVYKIGKKYEPEFFPINEIQYFTLLYRTQQYKEAVSVFEHLKTISPGIEKTPFVAFYEECVRKVGL